MEEQDSNPTKCNQIVIYIDNRDKKSKLKIINIKHKTIVNIWTTAFTSKSKIKDKSVKDLP